MAYAKMGYPMGGRKRGGRGLGLPDPAVDPISPTGPVTPSPPSGVPIGGSILSKPVAPTGGSRQWDSWRPEYSQYMADQRAYQEQQSDILMANQRARSLVGLGGGRKDRRVGMKALARGGRVQRGQTALVGEAGSPETVTVTPGGEAVVRPTVPLSKDVTTQERTVTGSFGGTPVFTQTDTKQTYPTNPDPYLESLVNDYMQNEDMLRRIQENEQAAMDVQRQGMEGIQAGRGEAVESGKQAGERIRAAGTAATGYLEQGVGAAESMRSNIRRSAEAATSSVKKQAGAAVKGAEKRGAEDIADAERRAALMDELGTSLMNDIKTELDMREAKTLSEYKDMTASMVSRKEQAINNTYAQQKESMVAQLRQQGVPEAEIKARTAQLSMQKMGDVSVLSGQIGQEYNTNMSNIRMFYTSEKNQAFQKVGALQAGLMESGAQLVANVRAQVGARVDNLRQVGLQATTSMSESALQAKSWAEQKAGEITAQLRASQGDLQMQTERLELANEQLVQQTKLSYDMAMEAGMESLANSMWNQTEKFVPTSPLYATVLNFWTQKELMGQTEYPAISVST